jgi:hypothetical protein
VRAQAVGLYALEKFLEGLSKKALPHAIKQALNTSAFETRKEWIEQVQKRMVLRNTWTARSLRVKKAIGVNLATMHSKVGSTAPYMETQERGGMESKGGRVGVPIPTTSAAGQAMKAKPRTRQVRKGNWLSAIQIANRVSGRRQRRNAVAIMQAAKGSGYAFLDLGRRKGIFRIYGTKSGRLRVRMLWDMSRSAVKTKQNPTLELALQQMQPRLAGIHFRALAEQVRRQVVGWK